MEKSCGWSGLCARVPDLRGAWLLSRTQIEIWTTCYACRPSAHYSRPRESEHEPPAPYLSWLDLPPDILARPFAYPLLSSGLALEKVLTAAWKHNIWPAERITHLRIISCEALLGKVYKDFNLFLKFVWVITKHYSLLISSLLNLSKPQAKDLQENFILSSIWQDFPQHKIIC